MCTRLELEGHLKVMWTLVPALLDKARVTQMHKHLPLTPWEVEQILDAPQQSTSEDCNIFCTKFFNYVVTGSNMPKLTQENMNFFRR